VTVSLVAVAVAVVVIHNRYVILHSRAQGGNRGSTTEQ
jgi:hypothetical protein